MKYVNSVPQSLSDVIMAGVFKVD